MNALLTGAQSGLLIVLFAALVACAVVDRITR